MKKDDDSDEKKTEKDDSDELPEKMIKLLSFFDDLSTDFGRFCIMDKVKKRSAQDPINFDADPDPGSALEKNGSRSVLFL